jgi:hypothetical protein
MMLYFASTESCLFYRHTLQASTALYLPDALDAWESFAGTGSGKGARLYQGPYALAAIRPRPIMLDSAAGALLWLFFSPLHMGCTTVWHKLGPHAVCHVGLCLHDALRMYRWFVLRC